MEPFQVMCVNVPDNWVWMKAFYGFDYPKVGDEVTVVDKRPCSCGKHDQYQLAGFPYALYADHHFATLPIQSADEINELEKEAIIK